MEDEIIVNGVTYIKKCNQSKNYKYCDMVDFINHLHKIDFKYINDINPQFDKTYLILTLPTANDDWSFEVFEIAKQLIDKFYNIDDGVILYIDHAESFKRSKKGLYVLAVKCK